MGRMTSSADIPRREGLRLGVIAALTNQESPPWPTMAHDRVFNSRQDPLFQNAEAADMPAICVYTDDTAYEPLSGGQPPFGITQEIILELTLGTVDGRDPTDAAMESKLDLFEEQIMDALLGMQSQSSRSFFSMISRIEKVESSRLASSEGHVRLSMRDMRLVVTHTQKCKQIASTFPEFTQLVIQRSADS